MLQYGSGLIAYMARIPGLEYTSQESDMLASASSDVLGTMSSKKAKALAAFLAKWSPVLTLGGVVVATTVPKIQLTRAVLAERRLARETRAREIQDSRASGATPAPIIPVESSSVGLGVESGNHATDNAGRPDISFDPSDGARGLGVES